MGDSSNDIEINIILSDDAVCLPSESIRSLFNANCQDIDEYLSLENNMGEIHPFIIHTRTDEVYLIKSYNLNIVEKIGCKLDTPICHGISTMYDQNC